jgi:hypothetical protein
MTTRDISFMTWIVKGLTTRCVQKLCVYVIVIKTRQCGDSKAKNMLHGLGTEIEHGLLNNSNNPGCQVDYSKVEKCVE